MATIQTDIPYALARAGYLNNTKTPLRYYQKWYTVDEVLDGGRLYLEKELMYVACYTQLESADDVFQLLQRALDYPKYTRPRKQKNRNPRVDRRSSMDAKGVDGEWKKFLVAFGFLKESATKVKPEWLDDPRLYQNCTGSEKLALRKKLLKIHGDSALDEIDEAITISMVTTYDPYATKESQVSLPPSVTVENIKEMEKWESDTALGFVVDWELLSQYVDTGVVEMLPDRPWFFSTFVSTCNLTYKIIDSCPLDEWDECDLAENPSVAIEWLEARISGLVADPAVKNEYLFKPWKGVWRAVLYLTGAPLGEKFRYHAAAGVVQRVWRRHRERLRRKAFARTLLDEPSRLTVLPRDLQWLVYRFARPASVLRGLPPKFH